MRQVDVDTLNIKLVLYGIRSTFLIESGLANDKVKIQTKIRTIVEVAKVTLTHFLELISKSRQNQILLFWILILLIQHFRFLRA